MSGDDQSWTPRELPLLTEHQRNALEKWLQFEVPTEYLRAALTPLITFELNGPATLQAVNFRAGRPKNPIRVTRNDIESAIRKVKAGQITQRQLVEWATMVELNPAFDWSGDDEEMIANLLDRLSSGELS